MNAPLCKSMYLGNMNARSLDAAIELVEMLVPSVARPKAAAQKKAAARLVHLAMMVVGSQRRVP